MSDRSNRSASRSGAVRGLLILPLLLALLGCAADPYPLRAPPGSTEWHPTTIGTPVRVVVLYLEPRPGDRVDLVNAQPIGTLTGTEVRFYFSPPVISADGTHTVGETLDPLPGASVSVDRGASPGPENDVGIVAEFTPHTAGTFTLTAVRLTFRVNGGGEQTKDGISSLATICAADPAPTDCGATPPP